MRIPVINFATNYKYNNFQGLWGKTTKNKEYDDVLNVPRYVEYRYYYPFLDESQERISQIINENQDAYFDDNSNYNVRICNQCSTLPYDEQTYNKYANVTSRTELTKDILDIHSNIDNLYLDNVSSATQKPAKNNTITGILDLIFAEQNYF
jgi:hypothetical protein